MINWNFWKRTPLSGECKGHSFGRWDIERILVDKVGQIKVVQHRFCSACGYCEIDSQTE